MKAYIFPARKVDGEKLQAELSAAGIPVSAQSVAVEGDGRISVVTTRDLTPAEQSAVAAAVAAHIVPKQKKMKTLTKLDTDIADWIGASPLNLKRATIAALAIAVLGKPGTLSTLGIPVTEDSEAPD